MKKITISSLAVAALALPAVGFAQAQIPGAASPRGTGIDPILAILDTIGNWMFGVLIGVAAIYILLAAFKFLTAKGDAKLVTEARQALTYSIVAVVVGAITKGLIAVAKAIAAGSGI